IGLALGFAVGLAAGALEVGRIPAASFQLKAGGGYLFGELVRATRGARGQHGIGKLLQRFELVAAGRADIFVDRHDRPRQVSWLLGIGEKPLRNKNYTSLQRSNGRAEPPPLPPSGHGYGGEANDFKVLYS